jgi:CDP-4-dehydro-6-deoxyglucose reductase, E1
MYKMKIKLMEDSFTQNEVNKVIKCLNSGYYTQGKLVDKFEKKFAKWNNSKYAVMVNSGSSANLLIISLLKEKYELKNGDEIIVPSVTWPTTVYPIIQNNLKPVFCDVDASFNLDPNSIKKMITKKTKAIFLVHLLGQPANIKEIKKICQDKKIILIEDCCESLGAKFNNIKVGNFGIMGSFSFYFGHHMTTIEGGMIVTNDYELYDLLKSTRSHGWIRGSKRINDKKFAKFKDKNFVFDMLGYNFRSTDLNATIGLVQLKKLNDSIKKRIDNHRYFLKKIKELGLKHQKINLNETSSFSLAIIFNSAKKRDYILEKLPKKGIECRPIVTGNLLKQPVFKNQKFKFDKTPFSDIINDKGIYLPNHQLIDKKKIDYMLNTIKDILNRNST